MTYTPQTQWIGNTEPMQQIFVPPKPKRKRTLSKANIVKLLTGKPWMTAVEVSTALDDPPLTPDQVKSAERTMRRMWQCGAVLRRRSEFGALVFGVAE